VFSKTGIFRRVGTLAAGLFFLIPFFAASQTTDSLPGWILYEKGIFQYEQGRLDEALELFSLSGREGLLTPEALYWIGRIYEEEGDYLMAEQRYMEALQDARFLYVPGEQWNIRYSLAGIYLNRKEFDRYEQLLLSIFDQEMMRNEQVIRREHAFAQVLKESGMDKLLLLYRLDLTYSQEAASQLGVFYAREKAWKSALIKNLYTVLSDFTGGMEYLIGKEPDFSFPVDMDEAWEKDAEFLIDLYEERAGSVDPDFSFSRDLKTFVPLEPVSDRRRAEQIILSRYPEFLMTPSVYALLKLENESGLEPFLRNGHLYRGLFYLGLSLYEEGYAERAGEVWRLLVMSGRNTSWEKLAARMLKDPEYRPSSLIY